MLGEFSGGRLTGPDWLGSPTPSDYTPGPGVFAGAGSAVPPTSADGAYSREDRDRHQAPDEGPRMSDKSPRQGMAKKSGKSLKEKRADKRAKADGGPNDNILNSKTR